jgi:hypothetical protein
MDILKQKERVRKGLDGKHKYGKGKLKMSHYA